MVTVTPPRSRIIVAACCTVVGAALLGVQVALTFSALHPARDDVFTLVVGVFGVLVAGTALAAAVAVLRASTLSRTLTLAALAGSVVAEPLLDAPPRGIPMLPLAIAAGLMFVSSPSDRTSDSARHRPGWAVALGWLGIALHVAVAWLYLAAGLVVPWYGLIFLWGLWAVLLLLASRLLRDRPIWTPLVPVAAIALWAGVISLGAAFLGWGP